MAVLISLGFCLFSAGSSIVPGHISSNKYLHRLLEILLTDVLYWGTSILALLGLPNLMGLLILRQLPPWSAPDAQLSQHHLRLNSSPLGVLMLHHGLLLVRHQCTSSLGESLYLGTTVVKRPSL